MKFKINDKVRIKKGTEDPDVEGYIIGGLVGIVDDISPEGYFGVRLDYEFPDWYIDELERQSKSVNSETYLDGKELELVEPNTQPESSEQSLTELEKAVQVIEGLIDAINVMPIYWKEFVGDSLAEKAESFLRKHNPDRYDWLDDDE